MKGMLAHVLMEQEEKREDDMEPVKCWKEHYNDSFLMHKKFGIMANLLRFLFLPCRADALLSMAPGGSQVPH